MESLYFYEVGLSGAHNIRQTSVERFLSWPTAWNRRRHGQWLDWRERGPNQCWSAERQPAYTSSLSTPLVTRQQPAQCSISSLSSPSTTAYIWLYVFASLCFTQHFQLQPKLVVIRLGEMVEEDGWVASRMATWGWEARNQLHPSTLITPSGYIWLRVPL